MFHLLLVIIYISFISLGLPDSVLGAAWPTMYPLFDVPVSYAGIISVIICLGTIFSSLQSDRMTKRFGTGLVTAVSVAMTAVALFGFSVSHSFIALCLWAIPYGLGAGGVDASINNYVALHYASRHMSWLHCMWGVGAATGPYIMSYVLTQGGVWQSGYRVISIIQIILTVILMLSLPLWKNGSFKNADGDNLKEAQKDVDRQKDASNDESLKVLSLKEIFSIPGAKSVCLMFFAYCAIESTAGLWASSYLVLHNGMTPELAASFAGLFYIGITVGRGLSGFMTMRFNDDQMIRIGQITMLMGMIILCLPVGQYVALIGLILIGLGCAPVYPCIIHSTPSHFGEDKSQAIIGVQMAFAYTGSLAMPPLFGFLATHVSAGLYPYYLVVILVLMIVMHEKIKKMMIIMD